MDSFPNIRLANGHSFLPNRSRNRNHDQLNKHQSRSLSTRGLHILLYLDSRNPHLLERLLHFLQVPLLPANCSSLEVMHTDPRLHATIYI